VVRLDDLLFALEFVSGDMGNEAYLCVRTGQIFSHSDVGDNEEPLPDDVFDSEKYICIPSKRELGLGKPLALRFGFEALPDDFERIEGIFRQRGAYARFKDLLERRGLLDEWYRFESENQAREIREWCKAEGIELEGEPQRP
jgi:hypothetical protein